MVEAQPKASFLLDFPYIKIIAGALIGLGQLFVW